MNATILRTIPDLSALNAEFYPLGFQERITRLYSYFPVNEVLFTSSLVPNQW
ncbi:MAG: hypothetical protein HC821_02795 [Lewinella sp.]|nr:hypothetical protein [Lewinella sp.]